jgi:hypothetical protein
VETRDKQSDTGVCAICVVLNAQTREFFLFLSEIVCYINPQTGLNKHLLALYNGHLGKHVG